MHARDADPGTLEPLAAGWRLVGTEAGALSGPAGLSGLESVSAEVPGTVAGALAAAGLDTAGIDERDWWLTTEVDVSPAAPGESLWLWLDGIATVGEIFLDDDRVAGGDSMYARHALPLPASGGRLALAVCCRALAPRLRERRRPRARWRTRLVAEGNLRFFRTMLAGRAPGFAPGPPVIGLWRPVWIERRRAADPQALRLRSRLDGGDGVLAVAADFADAPGSVVVTLSGPEGRGSAALAVDGQTATGELRFPRVRPWWPHTHGEPALYDVSLTVDGVAHPAGRVGFRTLAVAGELERDGLNLVINGVPIFARGAVWTPANLLAPDATPQRLRTELTRAAAAGMNMIRLPGVGSYESPAFHDLCDELGLLVWQDVMLANLDYPESDEAFMAAIEAEVRAVLDGLAHRPSLAVVCGGSEVAQQVAMMGLDPGVASGSLYGELLPRLVAEAEVDAPYVPSTPWGGALPFRPDHGVANYYGVGAYRRPLSDARLAGVRFAAECLAFANVGEDLEVSAVHDPRWKAGVPRDVGAGWDFDDVRDHYLGLLYGVDPARLRSYDPERYLDLSRAVTGEVMAEVFGEWRRAGSPTAGGLVLWLSDLRPGAGWGVLDHRGEPKVAYHHLRRALAPVAVWTTDEGLNGIGVHVANDTAQTLYARLRVALYRDGAQLVEEVSEDIRLEPHGSLSTDVEALLGRFVDVSWAYRFGPPGQDLVAVSLQRDAELVAQAFRLPIGRPTEQLRPEELGLGGRLERGGDGRLLARLRSDRYAHGVRLRVPGHVADDDAFGLEPGRERVIALAPGPGAEARPEGTLEALNLRGRVRLTPG